MEFIISDACIFIDLVKIAMVDHFFKLPFEFYTTDFVINELTNPGQLSIIKRFIDTGRLKVLYSGPDELHKIVQIAEKHSKLSISDCSVFYFGKQNNLVVLTNDKRLRRLAKDIEVHGILWIFDNLISSRIVSKSQAVKKLHALMKINQRLPVDECLRRIKSWV